MFTDEELMSLSFDEAMCLSHELMARWVLLNPDKWEEGKNKWMKDNLGSY